jgi:hypothetical protein
MENQSSSVQSDFEMNRVHDESNTSFASEVVRVDGGNSSFVSSGT